MPKKIRATWQRYCCGFSISHTDDYPRNADEMNYTEPGREAPRRFVHQLRDVSTNQEERFRPHDGYESLRSSEQYRSSEGPTNDLQAGLVVGKQYKCTRTCGQSYSQTISCREGDIVTVVKQSTDGIWVWVSTALGRRGFIEVSCLKQRNDTTRSTEEIYLTPYRWYEPSATRTEIECRLKRHPITIGNFFVRKSSRPGYFALSVLTESNVVAHFLLPENNPQFYANLGQDKITDLLSFIAFYLENTSETFGKLVDVRNTPSSSERPSHGHSQASPKTATRPTGKVLENNKSRTLKTLVSAKKRQQSSRQRIAKLAPVRIGREALVLGNKIGVGNHGDVYEGKILNMPCKVAVKVAKPGAVKPEELLKEAEIMKELDNKQVVRLLAVVPEDPVYIVTEYIENGSLSEYLRKNANETISWRQQLQFALHIASGMAYLEENNFIHRDLRAANVLLDDNFTCKICDFGLARCLDQKIYSSTANNIPLRWSAPEVLLLHTFSHASDVWSYGILLYEIVTKGALPYKGLSNDDVQKYVAQGHTLDAPEDCNIAFSQRMQMCWAFNPAERPRLAEAKGYFQCLFTWLEVSEPPMCV